MSDITSQNLTELIKNIKNKKISSEEATKSFVEKEEKDSPITDNKKLRTQKIRLTISRFGGPECRSGDTPSIINGKGTVDAKEKKRNKIP